MRSTPPSRSRLAAVTTIIVIVVTGCGSDPQSRLRDAAEKAVESDTSFSLRTVVKGSWTRVYVFGAYQTPADARDRMGFDWPDAADKLPQDDGSALLVFVNGTQVVQAFEPELNVGCLEFRKGIRAAETRLRVEDFDGARNLYLASGAVNRSSCERSG